MIYLKLFLTFLKIGAFTFGGGYAMLPLIQSEVLANGWLTSDELINFIAVSESTPGPFAINISTYTGTVLGGLLGAFCATLGVVLPSFIIILIVAKCFEKFKESKFVKGIMFGLKPAVIGLIGAAVISIGKSVLSVREIIFPAIIFLISAILAFTKKNPILIILISAACGIAAGYIFNL